MISNKERRKVAEDLRNLSYGGRVRYKEEFFELLDETVMDPGTGYHEMNDVFDRLADLIDRPTCKFKPAYGPDSKGEVSLVECTACAWTIEPWIAHEFRYCPNCEAEVVDDGE